MSLNHVRQDTNWCETNCAKKTEGGLRPIAVGNAFRRLSANCAGYHAFESRQARYGSRQVCVGGRREVDKMGR